jgi:hypothetical protein
MTVIYNPRTETYTKTCNFAVNSKRACVPTTWKKAVSVPNPTEDTIVNSVVTEETTIQDLPGQQAQDSHVDTGDAQ